MSKVEEIMDRVIELDELDINYLLSELNRYIEKISCNNLCLIKYNDFQELLSNNNYFQNLYDIEFKRRKQSERKLKKAIKYIENAQEKALNTLLNGNSKVEIISFRKILDILKGSDNNEKND